MIIDDSILEEYPNKGTFYYETTDKDRPRIEWKPIRYDVLTTQCDIQEKSATSSYDFNTARWSVYFPFDKEKANEIKRGMEFDGDLFGLRINGEVVGIVPTQMGCVAYIKDLDV